MIEALDAVPSRSSSDERSVALALGGGGGGARAHCERDGIMYYFCSVNCRDSFERHGDRYGGVQPACGSETSTGGAQSGH